MQRLCAAWPAIVAWFLVYLAVPALAVEPTPAQDGAAAIIGGADSTAGGQPWMVAILRKAPASSGASVRQFCGGALVAPEWVLTAAHCVEDTDPETVELVIGREQLDGSGGEIFAVAEIILHPRFVLERFGNDIALLRLDRAAAAQPLRRATAADDAALFGASVDIHGWGFESYRDKYACDVNIAEPTSDFADYWCESLVYSYGTDGPAMQDGRLRLATYAECDARYREYLVSIQTPQPLPAEPYFSEQLTPRVLCAWDPAAAQAPCFGDSGGPLVGTVGTTQVLLGVVSFGYVSECARQGQLGIYSRVSHHADFIEDAMAREQALGFAALCPRRPELEFAIVPALSGGARVTLSWDQDHTASGWRLHHANPALPGGAPGSIELPAGQTDYAVELAGGITYYVALQARGTACDSAMSALEKVVVP